MTNSDTTRTAQGAQGDRGGAADTGREAEDVGGGISGAQGDRRGIARATDVGRSAPSAGGAGRRGQGAASDASLPRPPRQDPRPEGLVPSPRRSLAALSGREVLRVSKLWTQTILAPVVSSFLFILVFGLSLGSRIREFDGFPYEVFIVPGLIAMAMAQAAFSNNSSSILQARNDRYVNDVLAAPMHAWQMNFGLTIGGLYRALAIGLALTLLAIPLTDVPVERPAALAAAVLLLVVLFGALGTVVGIYATSFDHHSFVNNILILPLTFLGGVFYSIEILPPFWEAVSHINPLFYVVNAIRFGFLGESDVSVVLSFAVTLAMAAFFVAWSQWLFTSGRRLKP